MLHITNGDAAGEKISSLRPGEPVLAWQDVLHEGPVPGELSLPQLSAIRAAFIAARGWAPAERVGEAFRQRDQNLADARDQDEVVLWFDDDLYDQLQLIQILDWFGENDAAGGRLSLIEMTTAPRQGLFEDRQPVRSEQFETAARAWAAFRAPDPAGLFEHATRSIQDLPSLAVALRRFLNEYPSVDKGLGRTERQILHAIDGGARTRGEVFVASQASEERPFMGDSTLWSRLDDLAAVPRPLVANDGESGPTTPYRLTAEGEAVLAGRADALELNGIDRWFGGVHLNGTGPRWRWDSDRLIAS